MYGPGVKVQEKRSVVASFVLLDIVDLSVSCWNGADYYVGCGQIMPR